jgi:hypothetical protein
MSNEKEKSHLLVLSVEGYFSTKEIKAIQSGKAAMFLELEEDSVQREFDVDKDSLTEYGVRLLSQMGK